MDPKNLEQIPLFRELSRHEQQKVARWADEVDVPEGYHLLEEGRLPHEFFVILEGRVAVTHAGMHLADLGPGDFFGEIALVQRDRRTATVTTSTPTRLIVMNVRDFNAMKAEMPQVASKINDAILERLSE